MAKQKKQNPNPILTRLKIADQRPSQAQAALLEIVGGRKRTWGTGENLPKR